MRSYMFSRAPSVGLKALLAVVSSVGLLAGCGGAVIEPGHRGLRFDPKQGGLQHEVLQPGYHPLHCGPFASVCPRVDDFDVTYSTAKEDITTNSQEGLALNLRIALVYRPIIAELYQLDTEIGPNYYDEVVAPEFKSAARGVFARHSYLDLQKKNEGIENEIEAELRRRTAGKHVEISSVLLETVEYAPEIAAAVRAKIVSEQEAARQKQFMENEANHKKRAMEIAAEEQRMAIQAQAEQEKMSIEAQAARDKLTVEAQAEKDKIEQAAQAASAQRKLEAEATQKELEIKLATEEETQQLTSALATKVNERKVAEQEAQIAKIKADGDAQARVASARGEAQARFALAQAAGEEKKAEGMALTPMHVMMHAYDALAHLGGSGTTIMLGDWSKVPNFLFQRVPAFQSAFGIPWSPYAPQVAPPPMAGPTSYNAPTGPTPDQVFASAAGR
jgi:regulator of protease activity HflC (stomatin/prohibitin superfamily)